MSWKDKESIWRTMADLGKAYLVILAFLVLRSFTASRYGTQLNSCIRSFGLFFWFGVADIAAGLDMSPANIYKFFPSKDSIIEASVEQNLAELKMSRRPSYRHPARAHAH